MPRKPDYQPWSSKNGILLKTLNDNDLKGRIDWQDEDMPETLGAVKLYDVIKRMEAVNGTKPKTLTGRPYREEAILIQLKGAVVAACGNCHWQSKSMECTLALEAVEKGADERERLAAAKAKLLKHRTTAPPSSKLTKKRKEARKEDIQTEIEEEAELIVQKEVALKAARAKARSSARKKARKS